MGLSKAACWRRIRALEEAGVIQSRVTVLAPDKVNLPVSCVVSVRTSQHSREWLDRFTSVVAEMPEVVDFFRMSGDTDYLLRIVAPDIKGYDKIYQRLIESVDMMDVSSSFVMETIKSTTVLPLDYLPT